MSPTGSRAGRCEPGCLTEAMSSGYVRRGSRLNSPLLLERLEQPHIGEVLRAPGGALHLEQVLAVGDGDGELTERDLVGSCAQVCEGTKMGGQREHVERPVGGDEVPLIAGGEELCAGGGLWGAAVGAEGACVGGQERVGQSLAVLAGCVDRDVEVLREALASVCLDGDAADGHVLDAVSGEREEQLARVEGVGLAHRSSLERVLATSRPACSSAASAFQLKASSRRSDMGRRRAARTASAASSGSRTAACWSTAARSMSPV